MTTIYLQNGQAARLIEQLSDNRYLVEPVMIYGEEEEYGDPSGTYLLVNKVYDTAPTEKYDAEVKALIDKKDVLVKNIEDARKEKGQLERDIASIKNELAKLNEWRIDLSRFKNAERIIYFHEGKPGPIVIENKLQSKGDGGHQLCFTVNARDKEVKSYSTTYAYCDDRGYSQKIDQNYGFMFDLTDEDIAHITAGRFHTLGTYTLYDLQGIPGKYMSEDMTAKKEQFSAEQRERDKKRLQEQLENTQKQLEEFTAEN